MLLQSQWWKNPTVWVSALIVIGLCVKAILGGTFGQIGSDSDDAMRLMQVRDLLAGQSWFDVTQTRMGPEGGTDMHWSRLADIPILILIGLFDIVLPYATAESLAFSLWPPLCALLVIWGVLTGVRHMSEGNGLKARTFALVLLFFLLILHYRFAPGSIDHHNLQLALLAISAGYALDPDLKRKSGIISGVTLALSLAVGVEVYAFVAVMCGFFALIYLWQGEKVSRGVIGFGLAFALTLGIVFFTTVAPQNYGEISCDAYSLITLTAGAAGGVGLASVAFFLSDKSLPHRLAGLGVLGVLCIAVLVLQAPQCLANPLDDLPHEVRTLWLDNIIEARPLFSNRDEWFYTPPYAIGTSIVALALTLMTFKPGKVTGHNVLLASLLTMSLLLTLYQTRFYIFGAVLSLFVLAPWVARVYVKERENPEATAIKYILALAVSIPIIWGFPAVFLKEDAPDDAQGVVTAKACYSDVVLAELSKFDPGLVLATDNGTPLILMHTDHRALAGNYHRNVEGLTKSVQIFTSPAGKAEQILRDIDVDYVHLCRTTKESTIFAEYAPEGLMADLLKGDVPDYLTLIGNDLEKGAVSFYRVTR